MTDQFKEFLASGKSILKVQYKILMKITNSLIQSVSTHNIQIKEKMINNMKTSIQKQQNLFLKGDQDNIYPVEKIKVL